MTTYRITHTDGTTGTIHDSFPGLLGVETVEPAEYAEAETTTETAAPTATPDRLISAIIESQSSRYDRDAADLLATMREIDSIDDSGERRMRRDETIAEWVALACAADAESYAVTGDLWPTMREALEARA